jgi:hypothetical protein
MALPETRSALASSSLHVASNMQPSGMIEGRKLFVWAAFLCLSGVVKKEG